MPSPQPLELQRLDVFELKPLAEPSDLGTREADQRRAGSRQADEVKHRPVLQLDFDARVIAAGVHAKAIRIA
jgi:hypothetical protein